MISANMRYYDYYTFGDKDEYGQEVLSDEVKGSILLAIYTISNTIGTNIKYKDATYIALTYNKIIDDSYVIKYGDKKLKVLHTIPMGRYNQVFLAEM